MFDFQFLSAKLQNLLFHIDEIEGTVEVSISSYLVEIKGTGEGPRSFT